MNSYRELLSEFVASGCDVDCAEQYSIYPESINNNTFMMNLGARDVIISTNLAFVGEEIIIQDKKHIIGELCHENATVLRSLHPFTAPQKVLKNRTTFGCGDRLGIATHGHIRVFENNDIYPILAQQSMRELKLTNRTFESVLDDVTFAVFREGYKKGFGADGDHLKTEEDIEYALNCGYTMITLDCSDYIDNAPSSYTQNELSNRFTDEHQTIFDKYINKRVMIGNTKISFTADDLKKTILIYYNMIKFVLTIYNKYFGHSDSQADFELSIDETSTNTTLLQHYFISSMLYDTGVRLATVAPRFSGEFQKGIDYIGDVDTFETELRGHFDIAEHFGYKLSLHSGSDKFKVFSVFGQTTQKRFHVKTAGTSWLEAMRLVAIKDPVLYRKVHKYALDVFDEASSYYHVKANPNDIVNIDTVEDSKLAELFDNDDIRQLIHITYGFILNAKKENGMYLFRDNLYNLWRKHASDYTLMLESHIGEHINRLNSID